MSAKIVRVRPFAIAAIARNDGDVRFLELIGFFAEGE